jgi:hypothetical protein
MNLAGVVGGLADRHGRVVAELHPNHAPVFLAPPIDRLGRAVRGNARRQASAQSDFIAGRLRSRITELEVGGSIIHFRNPFFVGNLVGNRKASRHVPLSLKQLHYARR